MPARFATNATGATAIRLLEKSALDPWLSRQTAQVQARVRASGFRADLGEHLVLSDQNGNTASVLFGWGDEKARARGRFHLAQAAADLPAGTYRLESDLSGPETESAALGWLLDGYRFDRYKKTRKKLARLEAPKGVDAARLESIVAGEFLARDLINTPANDMGPDALEGAFQGLGTEFGAKLTVIKGAELIEQNYPMIHAVGRASDQAPRLLKMAWGNAADPSVTLVGKGVCFDTGGLNLKPAASIGLMKKDMGGAATVMGLARIIMSRKLPVRLRVFVPAVENSISASAYRPGDILTSRKGLTVEINNTDAEGRLVLADALSAADEDAPDHLICMATLTGAARVAVGPDLVPFYTDNDGLALALAGAATKVKDPLWRLPFWDAYEPMIEPDIADLDNAPSGGFAGSITAALFLRRFVEQAGDFTHFDIFGWNPTAAPARPKGASFQAARAIFEVLSQQQRL